MCVIYNAMLIEFDAFCKTVVSVINGKMVKFELCYSGSFSMNGNCENDDDVHILEKILP